MHPPLSCSLRLQRRALLKAAGAACAIGAAAYAPVARAQEQRALAVTQIVDLSPQNQDVSRDFLIGSRAAWTDLNARGGGIRGRSVQHVVVETDGSAAAVRTAWKAAYDNAACVALSGCVGDSTAAAIATLQTGEAALAHLAPWLLRQWKDDSDTVFPIFPNYRAQMTHAIRSLAVMGVQQAGAVYANATLQQQLQGLVTEVGKAMGLRIQPLSPQEQRGIPPAIVLFIGGTPELHEYVRHLTLPQGRQCYVVALADANLQVLAQLGGIPHGISVIATQPVPLVSHGMSIVRNYREVMAKLYDEPPSPQGLAGFIAARYTAEVLQSVTGPVTRASVLAALRKRVEIQVGGYLVAYEDRRLANTHVTQSMLTADGRIVG